mmetsp:Transcript_121530/g.288890  ORF Transcript_121530/g.288890 Transcript_121530/m.288890 type:complete len:158 (+) Transcript_121530:60-533(+)
MASPKRKHQAAKMLKVEFSKEFESRGIPLEDSSTERDAKELKKVASFFGMDDEDVHKLMQPEAPVVSPRLSDGAWLHRPVTPKELQRARLPSPISITDFPSIFPSSPRSQESHYDYFSRRLPGETPEHRKAMQWKTETARNRYKYSGRRAQSLDRWM